MRIFVAAFAFAVALSLCPASAQTTTGVDDAMILFKAKKFAETIAAMDVWIAAHPTDVQALVLRGDAKADLKDNEGALKDYDTAIALKPDYEYAYVTRCETRLQINDVNGALLDCNTAIRLSPADGRAYEDRGDIQF